MPTKKDLEEFVLLYREQISFFKEQIEELKKEKEEITRQLFNLQNGILNIRAPEAYRDMQADLSVDNPPFSEEELEEIKIRNDVLASYLGNIESPTFSNADEMEEALTSVLASDGGITKSLHNNDES